MPKARRYRYLVPTLDFLFNVIWLFDVTLLCVSDFHKRVGMLLNDLILEYAEEGKKEANVKVPILNSLNAKVVIK